MKLFSTPVSPFARKVRIVAIETGQQDAIEEINIMLTPIKADDALVKQNPAGKVPTLVTDDGTAIVDSRVICEYLDGLNQGPKLFPDNGPARWQALTRQALGDAIMDAGVLIRYENAVRPKEKYWDVWQNAQADKALRTIALLETQCGTFSETLDIGAITIACAVDYFDFRFSGMIDWRSANPQLSDWCDRFGQRPSLQATKLTVPAAQ